jgi:hypothetical protein
MGRSLTQCSSCVSGVSLMDSIVLETSSWYDVKSSLISGRAESTSPESWSMSWTFWAWATCRDRRASRSSLRVSSFSALEMSLIT